MLLWTELPSNTVGLGGLVFPPCKGLLRDRRYSLLGVYVLDWYLVQGKCCPNIVQWERLLPTIFLVFGIFTLLYSVFIINGNWLTVYNNIYLICKRSFLTVFIVNIYLVRDPEVIGHMTEASPHYTCFKALIDTLLRRGTQVKAVNRLCVCAVGTKIVVKAVSSSYFHLSTFV